MLHYQTSKLCFFKNNKEKAPFLSQLLIICKFICSGCKSYYVGKTDCTLHERTKETPMPGVASKNEQSAVYEHLSSCTHHSHMTNLFKMDTNNFNSNQFNVSQIKDNMIIDRGNNWNILLFKGFVRYIFTTLFCMLKREDL